MSKRPSPIKYRVAYGQKRSVGLGATLRVIGPKEMGTGSAHVYRFRSPGQSEEELKALLRRDLAAFVYNAIMEDDWGNE